MKCWNVTATTPIYSAEIPRISHFCYLHWWGHCLLLSTQWLYCVAFVWCGCLCHNGPADQIKAEMFPHFSCSCECKWDKDALFPLVSRGEYEFIIDDFDSCGLANFLIKVFDSAADSCCYLSRRPLAAPNERKNSLGGKIVVTLTSRAP